MSAIDVSDEVMDGMAHLESHIGKLMGVHAWKNARFCFTLPAWDELIEPISVIIWRDLFSVTKSTFQFWLLLANFSGVCSLLIISFITEGYLLAFAAGVLIIMSID